MSIYKNTRPFLDIYSNYCACDNGCFTGLCTDNIPTKFNERSVRKFLEVLALCHTVQATKKITANKSKNPLDLIYNAASPDEKAIVEACRNYGVAFLGLYLVNSIFITAIMHNVL